MPIPLRYGFLIFICGAILWTPFFLCCLVQNEVDDDPEEEAKFLKRVEKWERIKQERIRKAKEMKFD